MYNYIYISASVVGIVCIASAIYSFVVNRLFGLGGVVACLTGVVLLGFPLWQNIAIEFGSAHLVLAKNKEVINNCVEQAGAVVAESKNPILRAKALRLIDQAKVAAHNTEETLKKNGSFTNLLHFFDTIH